MGQVLTAEIIDEVEERTLREFESKRRRRNAMSLDRKQAAGKSEAYVRRFQLKDQKGNMSLATALLFMNNEDADPMPSLSGN